MAPQTKTKAKAARRLKVFQAVFGFHESVVAAPSQTAALSAWGAHQNLFADGAATLVADPDIVAAALAHPLTPLRRAVGSKGPFGLDAPPPALDIAPARAKPPKSGRQAKAAPSRAAAPPPDRSALDAAEAALEQLEAAQKRERQDLRRRREALDAEEAGARVRWAKDRAQARKAMKRERRAYLKAAAKR
jgi:type IV secretory pathway VirB10-like protein